MVISKVLALKIYKYKNNNKSTLYVHTKLFLKIPCVIQTLFKLRFKNLLLRFWILRNPAPFESIVEKTQYLSFDEDRNQIGLAFARFSYFVDFVKYVGSW